MVTKYLFDRFMQYATKEKYKNLKEFIETMYSYF